MTLPRAHAIEPRLEAMALALARAYMRRLPPSVCRGDIEQAALIGLMDGLRKHPDGAGPGYDWYLRTRIRGGIADELRAEDWSSRRNRQRPAPLQVVHLDDVDEHWGDCLPGACQDPETAAIARIDGARAFCAPIGARDERLLRAVFERGEPQREIGDAEGISEARVSQLVAVALGRMRTFLTAAPRAGGD